MSNYTYLLIEDLGGSEPVLLLDLFDDHPTVPGIMTLTNAAERVVADVFERGWLTALTPAGISDRRLFYYGTDHELAEMVHTGGIFKRFASGRDGPYQDRYAIPPAGTTPCDASGGMVLHWNRGHRKAGQ